MFLPRPSSQENNASCACSVRSPIDWRITDPLDGSDDSNGERTTVTGCRKYGVSAFTAALVRLFARHNENVWMRGEQDRKFRW